MGLISWIKIRAFNDAFNNLSEDKIADMIVDFGKRYFGENWQEYVLGIEKKLARICVALNKRG